MSFHPIRNPVRRKVARLSEQGRKAARVRWDREAGRREWMAGLDPVRIGGRIVRRIVVIDDERRVKERTFYEFDRPCDWKRKRKELLR